MGWPRNHTNTHEIGKLLRNFKATESTDHTPVPPYAGDIHGLIAGEFVRTGCWLLTNDYRLMTNDLHFL
jgi:hypothetical protein